MVVYFIYDVTHDVTVHKYGRRAVSESTVSRLVVSENTELERVNTRALVSRSLLCMVCVSERRRQRA